VNNMTDTITVERELAPGVHVRIEHVPATFRGAGIERQPYFDQETANRLGLLLRLARQRMQTGETDIRISYADQLQDAPKKRAKRS
jgi:hypothetical protein